MLSKSEIQEKLLMLLGNKNAIFGEDGIAPYRQNTLGIATETCNDLIVGVLKPSSTEEVLALVELANRHSIHLYPISTGRQWGYGSRLPTAQGSYIVELSNMNRIREVNDEVGYAVIEPGVTQEDLSSYLKENDSNFVIDKTGAPASTSIIGNTLERGWGLRCCREALVNGVEVVLGSGELLRTGTWLQGKPFFRYNTGPLTDQLFAQSNLGIVTAMSFKLHPRPDQGNVIFCTVERKNIESFIEVVREIKRIDSETCFKLLFNREYFTTDNSPLTAFVILFGGASFLEVRTGNALKLLGDVAELRLRKNICSVPKTNSAEDMICAFLHPDSGSEIDIVNVMFRHFDVSQPSGDNLDQVEDFGLWFYDCIIPFEFNTIKQTFDYCSNLVKQKYGLPFRITLHMYSHDYVVVVVYIIFNRLDSVAVSSARQCADELYTNKELSPLRLTPWHMDRERSDRDYLNGIKNTFDPNRIIAPGRYI